jgi:hypothetical protein
MQKTFWLGRISKSNILARYSFWQYMPFEFLLKQVIDPAAFPVWIPLAFGLIVGLAYVIASGVRHRR